MRAAASKGREEIRSNRGRLEGAGWAGERGEDWVRFGAEVDAGRGCCMDEGAGLDWDGGTGWGEDDSEEGRLTEAGGVAVGVWVVEIVGEEELLPLLREPSEKIDFWNDSI